MKELRGRVAVVTGAGSGIGAALARLCAGEGMRVVLADVERAAVESVAEDLCRGGAQAAAEVVDVRDPAALAAVAERTFATFGGCHLLVNNAGVVVYRPAAELELADWRWVLSVNLDGVIHGLLAFLPRMRAQGGPAHIVNTASIAGLLPVPGAGLTAYAASKYAVVGISESLRAELAPEGIGVSVVCPGGVATRIDESERNRPAELRTGAASTPAGKAAPMARERAEGTERFLPPEAVALRILQAVREDELYVITHPEWLPLVRERHAAIEAAFARAAARAERPRAPGPRG
jgi:NAD(P)-dependent dehydrogenase (short-subunit alcohol dehydrogenase family)